MTQEDDHFYTQVALSKGSLTRYTWLPQFLAIVDRRVPVREDDGTVDRDWKISKVFEECIIPKKYVTAPQYVDMELV